MDFIIFFRSWSTLRRKSGGSQLGVPPLTRVRPAEGAEPNMKLVFGSTRAFECSMGACARWLTILRLTKCFGQRDPLCSATAQNTARAARALP
jgi:hypothetical protein